MAYKVFANGFPLQASELNTNLMQQSIAVFTDATARDTDITSPVHGQFVYLTSTDELLKWDGSAWVAGAASDAVPLTTVTAAGDLIVADGSASVTNLGIGSDNQVLTVVSGEPSWVTPSGGALEWTQISYTSWSTGASSAVVSGLSGYDNYCFVMTAEASAQAFFNITLNGDQSGWKVRREYYTSGSPRTAIDNSEIGIGLSVNSSTTMRAGGFILDASGTTPATIDIFGGGSNVDEAYDLKGTANKNDVALNSIGIVVSGGTITGGDIRIFGA